MGGSYLKPNTVKQAKEQLAIIHGELSGISYIKNSIKVREKYLRETFSDFSHEMKILEMCEATGIDRDNVILYLDHDNLNYSIKQ